MKKIIILNIFVLILLVIDQIVKNIILKYPSAVEGFFNNPILQFKLYKNTGIAFSIHLPQFLLVIITIILIIILSQLLSASYKNFNIALIAAQTSVIAGAISNLIDRLIHGFIIDYLQLIFYWWIFNLADLMIVCGIGLWIYQEFKRTLKH